MERMNKVKDKKEEDKKREGQLFKNGSTWKPQVTQPKEPNLTKTNSKGNGTNPTVKSLMKPFNRPGGRNNGNKTPPSPQRYGEVYI
mmetsp:Transcript_40772/g.39360  ORF Transcript_40772/g.39360 Transcript_40772/m.39360 type:complete len:86 (+) Transcript_40772:348-605(+)